MSGQYTAAFKIFNFYFRVMVPKIHGSANMRTMIGSDVYSSQEQERAELNETELKQYTINDMIELRRAGSTITFVNPDDSVKVYEIIKQHLEDVNNRTNHSLHTKKINMADMQDLDDFAREIHRVARNYAPVDITQSTVGKRLDELMRSRGLSRTLKPKQEHKDELKPKEHRSILANISKTAVERNLIKPEETNDD